MSNANKQIKIGSVLSYFSIAVNILAGLIYTPWMIEQIGKGDYGLYTLASSLISLFLIDFGLGSAVSRYVSKYLAEKRQDKVDNFLGIIFKLYLIIDIIIFIVLAVIYFFIDSIYVKLTPSELEKFKVVYLMAASFAVINFPFTPLNGILNAYEKFIQLKLADVIYRVLLIGLTIAALIFGQGLYALVAVHSIVGIVIVVYKLIVIKKCIKLRVNYRYSDRVLYKDIFGFSIWVTISSLAQRLVFNITPSILGVVANSAAIAVFGIVTQIEGYAYTITSAINGMFMPRISRIYEQGEEKSKLMPLLLSVGKFQYALNGLLVVGFAVIGKEFINLWMAPSYSDAYYGILLVLIPGMFFNSLQIANTAMVVEKKVNLQAWVNLAMGLLNICLSFVLSSIFGVIGACISISVAYMLRAIVLIVIYKKVLNIDAIAIIKDVYIRMGVPIVLVIIIGFLINWLITGSGWLNLALKGVIVVIIYLAITFFIGLKQNEKIKLLKVIKKER